MPGLRNDESLGYRVMLLIHATDLGKILGCFQCKTNMRSFVGWTVKCLSAQAEAAGTGTLPIAPKATSLRWTPKRRQFQAHVHGASPAHSFTWFRLVCYQSSTEAPARPQTSSLPLQPVGNCPQGTRTGIGPPEEEQERCSPPLPAHLHPSASRASHPHGAGTAVRSLLCQGAG